MCRRRAREKSYSYLFKTMNALHCLLLRKVDKKRGHTTPFKDNEQETVCFLVQHGLKVAVLPHDL